ncbi:MAG: KUP/HAK/KT family potassium transporter, partial [Snodgrassella sp.]|nr:KUP/HAK/KT family potassium transporter [Snodgrassella sp.]
ATIIASQAVIAGAFSLTRQAIQLGFAPRMNIIHTNNEEVGQIYLPLVNWLLLIAVALVVLAFHDSEHLASAYGIAVTGTMVITSCLFCVVMIKNWRWPIPLALLLTSIFLCFDLVFFGSNLLKLIHGGWFPVLVAMIVVTLFSTWRRGQQQLHEAQQNKDFPLDDFIENLHDYPPQIVSGNAVFMVSDPFSTPRALLHNLKHNKVLHNYNVLLSIKTKEVPHIADNERIAMKQIGARFTRVIANYGFQETADISHILGLMAEQGITLDTMETSFFLSHDSIVVAAQSSHGKMGRLRARIFKWLYKNSATASNYYHIPANRVVELGAQVVI